MLFERYENNPEGTQPELFAPKYDAEPDLAIVPSEVGGPNTSATAEVVPIIASSDRGARQLGMIGSGACVEPARSTPAADSLRERLPRHSIEADLSKLNLAARAQMEQDYQRLFTQLYGGTES